jgi:hypothetical protein
MEYIEFDTVPINEDCVSVSRTEDYMPAMREEAERMLELLHDKFHGYPGYFKIASCQHDFGTYLEIRYYYNDNDEGVRSMMDVEENYPMDWNDTTPRYWGGSL